jgi:hypothetical protein
LEYGGEEQEGGERLQGGLGGFKDLAKDRPKDKPEDGGGGGQQKEAKANSATKDKQFLSQVKHRVRHERLVSLLVCVVLSFALLFCHCLLCSAQRTAGH